MAALSVFALLEMPVSQVVNAIREGLPVGEFNAVAESFQMTTDDLASILGISARTIRHQRKEAKVLSRDLSEKLLRIARVRQVGLQLFSDDKALLEWLATPAPSLDGHTPFEMLDTEVGAREVESVLQGIAYGNVI